MKYKILLLLIGMNLWSCDSLNQVLEQAQGGLPTGERPSNTEIETALRQALSQGIRQGSLEVGKTDGYYQNPLIRIPWPEDAVKIKNTLSKIGLKKQVEKVEMSINRAAERAALESVDVFTDAISGLSFQDVVSIVTGPEDAATNYLKTNTSQALQKRFTPIIDSKLKEVKATRYWTDVINTYNDLPTTFNKVNPDLTSFVTEKAIEGLFKKVAEKEQQIRNNPVFRTTSEMRKVFAYFRNSGS